MNYYQKSIDVIIKNQHASGAYIASPNFPDYRYCWLKRRKFYRLFDGSGRSTRKRPGIFSLG